MISNAWTRLKNKARREAFVSSQISVGLPSQIYSLRQRRGWTQQQLAERAGMSQPRIAALEQYDHESFTLATLRRLAAAFDIGLVVRFASFSDMVRWRESYQPDKFDILPFTADSLPAARAASAVADVTVESLPERDVRLRITLTDGAMVPVDLAPSQARELALRLGELAQSSDSLSLAKAS